MQTQIDLIRQESRRRDPWGAILWVVSLAAISVFFWVLADIVVRGVGQISWSFIVDAPRNAGRSGGIGPILVSTVLILLVCLAAALPLAVGAALFLVDVVSPVHPASRFVRVSLDTLAAVPSVVFGLFGSAFFCVALGLGFSILSGGLTLACMILPLLIRTTESSIRAVPQQYRYAAAALGFSKSRMMVRVILPMASPGILVGTLLGLGRAIAETVVLVFTSGYVDRMPSSLLDSGRSLSIHIFDLSMNVPGGESAAYGTAVVLVCVLFVINGAVLCLAKLWKSRTGLNVAVAA
jgi:phosphate transport system permease protein